jgi:cyclohexyl-isocyanide hydratase
VDARVVRDGNLVTGGGVTAGIDFALTLAADLVGQTEAETAGLILEYVPEPPFGSSRTDRASPAVLDAARARVAASRRAREAILARIVR